MNVRAIRALLLVVIATAIPARAERPIVDLHRLDAYFALFAADSNVPWKTTSVRLDTYSSAPVHFSVYRVDPADVLTAGSNARPRAVATQRLRPVRSFDFTPPGGFQFQSNEVEVGLGAREGFYVVEARRGNVGEQVWINRTRVGLLAKETASDLTVYGADLGTGRALPGMRVQFVVSSRFVVESTDSRGIVRWSRTPRPVFALAQWGDSYAFLSLLPQPPLPSTVVGVRTDSAVARAGGSVRVVGFARSRTGVLLRPSNGTVTVSLRSGAASLGEHRVAIDVAGAFSTSFEVPAAARAGDYAVIAQSGGGVGSATVHVDASPGGLSLSVSSPCGNSCDPHVDVPLTIRSSQGGAVVNVTVVRSPHVFLGSVPDRTPWGTTVWLSQAIRTGSGGIATLSIPHPSDELSSTYGVRVESGGATADTRVVVPTARSAIELKVDRDDQTLDTPVGFDVDAVRLDDGKPFAGAAVTVRLVHGTSTAQQQLTLDADGHARGTFAAPPLGTSLILASLDDAGRATDAAAVQVESRVGDAQSVDRSSAGVQISLDKNGYRAGDAIAVTSSAPGGRGDALLTLESAVGTASSLVPVDGGRASARFRAQTASGDLRAGAAFVANDAIAWATVPLEIDAPGRPQIAPLSFGGREQFSPGDLAAVSLVGAPRGGTFAVRVSRNAPSGSAVFDSAPALLAVGVMATQTSASSTTTWHPWVDSSGNHAAVLGFVRRTQPPADLALAQADTDAVAWDVVRSSGGDAIPLRMPAESGRYVVSVLEMADDGSVCAGSATVVVR